MSAEQRIIEWTWSCYWEKKYTYITLHPPLSSCNTTNILPTLNLFISLQYVHEAILEMKFRVSPDAFFQTNTAATQLLYQQVRDLCRHGNDSSGPPDVASSERRGPAIYGRCVLK